MELFHELGTFQCLLQNVHMRMSVTVNYNASFQYVLTTVLKVFVGPVKKKN